MLFDGKFRFTKEQVADFFKVDASIIYTYLSISKKELKHNDYELFNGNHSKIVKNSLEAS